MTEEYAPEEPEYDPDYEPDPDDVFYEPEPEKPRPEPEDRRDPQPTADEAKARNQAWVRKIRAEHGLVSNPNLRSGRDQ